MPANTSSIVPAFPSLKCLPMTRNISQNAAKEQRKCSTKEAGYGSFPILNSRFAPATTSEKQKIWHRFPMLIVGRSISLSAHDRSAEKTTHRTVKSRQAGYRTLWTNDFISYLRSPNVMRKLFT